MEGNVIRPLVESRDKKTGGRLVAVPGGGTRGLRAIATRSSSSNLRLEGQHGVDAEPVLVVIFDRSVHGLIGGVQL